MNTSRKYDSSSPRSIFEYGSRLIGHTLREIVGNEAVTAYRRKGKGGFGQMIEELYFEYEVNSNPSPDFEEAGVELKGTGLKKLRNETLQVKERLVIDIINFCEVINEPFEASRFYTKCRLMLILFYLYEKGIDQVDWHFLYAVLWKIPEKDLLIIRNDYNVIVEKIRRGEAHLLSEGDTEYLGACRKGQKGDAPRVQPCSDIRAPQRAFSLKPAYMRTVLDYIRQSGRTALVNFDLGAEEQSYNIPDAQITSASELQTHSFEEIILSRFAPYRGKTYREICTMLNESFDTSKSKYALLASLIVKGSHGHVNQTEEFRKAGLQLKTIRVEDDGSIRESMSFENINYHEVLEADNWYDSRLYEIFSGRFLFVVFKADGGQFQYINNKGNVVEEASYALQHAFFWTMPDDDLSLAEQYWEDIRQKISDNLIAPRYFNASRNPRFHVRPKATRTIALTDNPNGGMVKKYCYWFNNSYVREIVNTNKP